MTADAPGGGGDQPPSERRIVPRIDRADFDTVLSFHEEARYAALAFVGPRPNVTPDRGDWLMTLNDANWVTVYVCVIGPGSDFAEPSSAITASEIALSQAGYSHHRTAVDSHLTAAWEIQEGDS